MLNIPQKLHHQTGFSLIELTIAISVLGILSSIALVNLSSSWANSRLLTTTQQYLITAVNCILAVKRSCLKMSFSCANDFELLKMIFNIGLRLNIICLSLTPIYFDTKVPNHLFIDFFSFHTSQLIVKN